MKKSIVIMAAAAVMIMGTTKKANAQCVEKGTIAVDAYYGFPNLLTTAIKTVYADNGYDNYKVSGFGPAGIRGEYLINDHIAFGVDVNYSVTNIEWSEEGSTYTSYDPKTGIYVYPTYNYKINVPRLRALAKFNAHFGSSDHFDWYAGAGVGYNHTTLNLTTNDPSYTEDEDLAGTFFIPVAARIDFGGRYFFTDNIGLGFEVGLGGGPLASLGLNVKF
ncbi:MAG TPA: hypothetical protein PK289_02100 [Bacteroidia bacterium]|nr:hypothetical protein [Bacteroidia bacterium]HRG51422.1 hypothetical protein [Bacteroidia bacterium]